MPNGMIELMRQELKNQKIKVDEEYLFEMNEERNIWKNTVEIETSPELKKWKFTTTTSKLIEINDDLIATLPKSDSRFRSDRIALEQRQIKIAGKEKHIIEELQRKKRRYRDRHNLEFQPKYFEKATINDIEFWQYNGEYDKKKKK